MASRINTSLQRERAIALVLRIFFRPKFESLLPENSFDYVKNRRDEESARKLSVTTRSPIVERRVRARSGWRRGRQDRPRRGFGRLGIKRGKAADGDRRRKRREISDSEGTPVVGFSIAGPRWLVAMRGLPISRGKLYPGYRLFRRLRFVVGGNRRERSSNERVARPLDAPLVFARRRFIEILFLWPARARADARRGDVRERGEMRADDRPKETRESPLLLISSAFLPPSRARAFRSVSILAVLPPPVPHRAVPLRVLSRYATLFHPRARACSLSRRNLARPRSRFLAAARLARSTLLLIQ